MLRRIFGYDHQTDANFHATLVNESPSGSSTEATYAGDNADRIETVAGADPFTPGWCLKLYSYWNNIYQKYLLDNQALWYLHLYWRIVATYSPDNGTSGVFQLVDGGHSGTPQIRLAYSTTDSKLRVQRYNGSGWTDIQIGTTTLSLPTAWRQLRASIQISNSAGVFKLLLDGATEFDLTGIDTQYTANAYANSLWLANNTGTFKYWTQNYDHLVVCDGQAAPGTPFAGELSSQRVRTIWPSSDVSVACSRSGGAANYTCVDEQWCNQDTDYVYGNASGLQDLYGFTWPTPTYGVGAVQVAVIARRVAGTTSTIRCRLRVDGTDYYGDAKSLTTGYSTYTWLWPTNPKTGKPWNWATPTPTLQAGFKIESTDDVVRVSQVVMEVLDSDGLIPYVPVGNAMPTVGIFPGKIIGSDRKGR